MKKTNCTSTPAFDCFEYNFYGSPSDTTNCKNTAPDCILKGKGNKEFGSTISVTNNPLFLNYKAVLANTEEALPACMAMHGPQLKSGLLNQNFVSFNQCDQMFETSFTQTDPSMLDPHYLKWSDVKCNQRTRSQICTILGNKNYLHLTL